MQFTIQGRFVAEVRRENDGWTVSPAPAGTLPGADAISRFASLEQNDIGHFLDELLREYAGPEQENPRKQDL